MAERPDLIGGADVAAALADEPPQSVVDESQPKRKPYGKWAAQVSYDPDSKTSSDKFLASAPDYAKRFVISNAELPTGGDGVSAKEAQEGFLQKYGVQVPGHGGKFIAREVGGQVMLPIREGNRWKPVAFDGVAQLKQLSETQAGHDKQMMEGFGSGFGIDDFDAPMGGGAMDATRLWDREFVPIMAGPFYKQLYIYDYLLMHAMAFEMTNHNALAAGAIKIMQRFTIGRGISYHIKDDAVRKVWDEFWRRNNMKDKYRQFARDLPWQGELMVRFYEKQKGYTAVRSLDPSTCWEVVTDPEDFEHVYYYHFQWPTPYQIWTQGQIPVAKYIIQQIPPTNIIHLKINVSSQEKRGRSDLLPSMPWLKRFNDYYNGQTVKAVLEANLVFKIKVKGDQQDVEAFLQNPALTELPPPGGTWIENEAVDLTATSTVLTAGRGSQGIGQQIAAIVAASLNLPAEYFNIESSGPARATALVRTDPAVKTIEDRQQLLRELSDQIFERVIADAIDAGRLDLSKARRDPERVDEFDDEQDDVEPDEPVQSKLDRGTPTRATLVRTRS
jgi:hypothetical protein